MKPRVSVHKFSSCDGCQLAFVNAGADLLALCELVDIIHFAEAGYVDEEAEVDVAFVEGSVSTPAEKERIQMVRKNSKFLITIGACATSGGLQALRNLHDVDEWNKAIYSKPEFVKNLPKAEAISKHVKVDFEIWGCPVNPEQVFYVTRQLLFGVAPELQHDSACIECKRRGIVCNMITKDVSCLGPVTQRGCGALCPHVGRACYGCFGPSENPNAEALGQRFEGFGLMPEEIARKFLLINSDAPAFAEAGEKFKNE